MRSVVSACCIISLVSLLAAGVQGAEFVYTTNNGAVTMAHYTGKEGTVIIPSDVGGLPVTTIGSSAFWRRDSVTNVVIPQTVTNIAGLAFYQCTNLTSVVLGDGLKSIEDYAFSTCTRLASVAWGTNLTSLGFEAFYCCASLTIVALPDCVTSMEDEVFAGCARLASVSLGARLRSIPDGTFAGCTDLTTIRIPDGITNIGRSAFYRNTNLSSVALGNGVTVIGSYAFENCTGLTAVTLPDSVASIGEGAFYGCSELTTFAIGRGLTGIANWAFTSCKSLMAFVVDPLNPYLTSVDGVLFNKDITRLIRYPLAKPGAYTIPHSVTEIGFLAFSGSVNLTSITVPDDVAGLVQYSLMACPHLTAVYFLGNAPEIHLYKDLPVFDPIVTVYYLPGTTGWRNSYGGRPTSPWLLPYPLVLTTRPSFGIQTNHFGFIVSWATNTDVVVERTSSLENPSWLPLATNTLVNGCSYFSDAELTNNPMRFYRARQR